ncbi:hypothetical protein Baya_10789 [Bagarius yarrelli]|uniref:DNA damage-induced apoptosis suppressor protein n=1 Tax=Bagarius yarrelli TaxID=175774 RepID=A0A556UZC6_BAGYA|nr:hypothetical protein Baya_10789 [Bagarius yarrelli]
MTSKRVLLSCTVISLQDTRFVYPCCKVCLCRVLNQSNSRFIDSETFKGPLSLRQLLIKAVEDCFIGKCLVFGLKLSVRDAENCLFGKPAAADESVQFVACQVIPPHGALLGVPVFAYLQSLMQVNAPANCSTNAGCQWQEKESPVGGFDHTLPECQNSRSANDNDSLTLPLPWNLVSDLDLCFSLDETEECPVPEVPVDDNNLEESLALQGPNRESAEFCSFNLSESKHTKHNRSSTLYRSSINASIISPIKNTPSVVHSSKRLLCNGWAAEDCFSQINASFPEKPLCHHTSFALEDAPLSETLGDFVSTDCQFVNQQVLHNSISKETSGTSENNALIKNNIVPSNLPVVLPPHSPVSILTPLRDITNDKKPLKKKNGKRESFLSSKGGKLSRRSLSCDIKDVVSNRNEDTAVQNHQTKTQENQSSVEEDAYDFSTDLFYQSNVNILDVSKSSSSDAGPSTQNRFADVNDSEPNSSRFQFAPSLQSTPIVVPPIQRVYKRQKHSKNCSGLNGSRKSLTRTSIIRVPHTNNSQGLQLLRPKLDQTSDSALETFEISAGGSELKGKMKRTTGDCASPTVTNDCSRDLFDSLF